LTRPAFSRRGRSPAEWRGSTAPGGLEPDASGREGPSVVGMAARTPVPRTPLPLQETTGESTGRLSPAVGLMSQGDRAKL
jgi:hypothetical protein